MNASTDGRDNYKLIAEQTEIGEAEARQWYEEFRQMSVADRLALKEDLAEQSSKLLDVINRLSPNVGWLDRQRMNDRYSRILAREVLLQHFISWQREGREIHPWADLVEEEDHEVRLRTDPVYFCECVASYTQEGRSLEEAYNRVAKEELGGSGVQPFGTFASFKNGFYERGFKVRHSKQD